MFFKKKKKDIDVEAMTIEELVKTFDPMKPDSEIGKKLKELVDNRPCLVFATDTAIDVKQTVKLVNRYNLLILIKKLKPDFYIWSVRQEDWTYKETYKIGDSPMNQKTEHEKIQKLLEAFSVNHDPGIGEKINSIVKGRKCLIFNVDRRTINIEKTMEIIKRYLYSFNANKGLVISVTAALAFTWSP